MTRSDVKLQLSQNEKIRTRASLKVKLCSALIAATCVLSSNAQAQQKPDWWFDIEVIVFKRNIDGTQLKESFPFELQPIEMQGVRDLLTPYLHPDIRRLNKVLPNCYQQDNIAFPKQTAPAFTIDESVFEPLPPVEVSPQYGSQYSDNYPFSNNEQSPEQDIALRGSRERSDARDDEISGLSEEEKQIQSLQMAFAMPDEVPENTTDGIDTPNSDASSQQAIQEHAFQEEIVQTESDSSDVANDIAISEGYQEAEQEPSAPQAIYDAMEFQTEKQQYQLAHWEIPANLGCSFSNNKPRFWLNDIVDTQLANPDLLDYLPSPELESPFIESVPNLVDSFNRDDVRGSYLLPASQLRLKKLARDISRKRGLQTMLHLAWRQPVRFGSNRSPGFRLIAGKNYAKDFANNGYPLPPETLSDNALANITLSSQEGFMSFTSEEWVSEEDRMLNDIKNALAELDKIELRGAENAQTTSTIIDVPDIHQDETNKELWELDGIFKVYLQNIGRTPYLHIDSKLNFRQPMLLEGYQLPERILQSFQQPSELSNEANGIQLGAIENTSDNSPISQPQYFLKPYHFQQLRRVISRQIHYFDHPMFGMVVQIRRYKIPDFMR